VWFKNVFRQFFTVPRRSLKILKIVSHINCFAFLPSICPLCVGGFSFHSAAFKETPFVSELKLHRGYGVATFSTTTHSIMTLSIMILLTKIYFTAMSIVLLCVLNLNVIMLIDVILNALPLR
jgi:hypothetical protein